MPVRVLFVRSVHGLTWVWRAWPVFYMSRAGVGPVCRCAGVAGACFILTGASEGVLDVLKSVYLGFRKVKVQRVTVVEFGMYDRSGDSVGCLLGILLRLLVVWVFTAYFHRVVNITVVG